MSPASRPVDGASGTPTGRRAIVATVCAATVAANLAFGGEWLHRLPYLLAVLTVVFLMQTFWEERVTAGSWLAVGTATLIVALVVSITLSVNRTESEGTTDRASAPTTAPPDGSTSTTLLSGTDVPAEVAGAVETRSDAELLVACEATLGQIAAALRATGTEVDAAIAAPPVDAPSDASETARRLASCDVRLRAIAETLPG